jgi:hypothetical protein
MSDWPIHEEMLVNLAQGIWRHQQALRANPDPCDPWWFLVDIDAAPPTTMQPLTASDSCA